MSKNKNLIDARNNKRDEFYTQMCDIENELQHYKDQFNRKVVYCNCDNPYESNFFKFFMMKFNELGLKELICTCYDGGWCYNKYPQYKLFNISENNNEYQIQSHKGKAYKIIVTHIDDFNGNGTIDLEDIELFLQSKEGKPELLKGNGDFRSEECIELLKEADIVVTNPPFSLFREYVAQLMEYNKMFLIIGSMDALTYKEIFPLFRDNKIWYGVSIHSGDRKFYVPDTYTLDAASCGIDEDGRRFIRVKGVRWFTNLDYPARHERLILWKKYTPEEFPKYDNYDAINVNKYGEIPEDYDGIMGVPITFIDHYCPEQFEIVGNEYTLNIEKGRGYVNGKRMYARIFVKLILNKCV